MLWSPCIISISATMAALFLSPLGNDRDGQRITLTAHWMDHSAYLIIELLLWRSHIFMSISIWRDLATSVLPKYLSYQFSSYILFKSLTIQPNNCIQPVNQCIITYGNFSLQEKCMTMCAAQSFFPLWREEIPSSVSFRVATERCCNDISVCFWVVPACVQNKLENQVLVFYTSVNWS